MNDQNTIANRTKAAIIVHQDSRKLDLLAEMLRNIYTIYKASSVYSAINQHMTLDNIEQIIIDSIIHPISGVALMEMLYDSPNRSHENCSFILLDECGMITQKPRLNPAESGRKVYVYSGEFNPDSIYKFCSGINPDSYTEKRQNKRIELSKTHLFKSDLNLIEKTRIINLSEKGALIDHPVQLQEGEFVMLRLWTDKEKLIHLLGKVVRKAECNRFGIIFANNDYRHAYNLLSLKMMICKYIGHMPFSLQEIMFNPNRPRQGNRFPGFVAIP